MAVVSEGNGLIVLVDDARDWMDGLIIRNPCIAYDALCCLHDGQGIAVLGMDNDMGYDAPYEGHCILNKFLRYCQSIDKYPQIIRVVTANVVAAQIMRLDLPRFSYRSCDGVQWGYTPP